MYPETPRSSRPFFRRGAVLLDVFVAMGLLALLAGCGNFDSVAQSRVRALNTYVPAAGTDGSMNITNAGQILNSGTPLGFGQFANGGSYISVPSGVFNPAATGTTTAFTLQFSSPPTLNTGNTAYTLAAAGEAGQTGTLVPQLVLLPDYTPDMLAISTGSVAVRVVNFTENPNPIGLYATTGGVPTTALLPALGSIPYGYTSTTNAYVNVATTQLASLALVDTTAPTTALSLSTTSNLNTFAFAPGQAYTLYIYGQPGNLTQPLGATWVQDYPN